MDFVPGIVKRVVSLVGVAIVSSLLSACGTGMLPSAAEKPISLDTQTQMHSMGLSVSSPVLIRIFKRESELEIWKRRDDGRYAHFRTYPICKWSGNLGPKLKQGDKQAPEGFYTVSAGRLNPKSQFHLSFNLGYPNKLDKAYNRTGKHLMVHGDCRSAGCYAMTDALIEEIYAIVREALRGGQKQIQVQAYPFRMTKKNMALVRNHRWAAFWQDLKKGYDAFEISRIPPKIDVCERRYIINAAFHETGAKPSPRHTCPPYRTFIPDIIETPNGPEIVQLDANAKVNPYAFGPPPPAAYSRHEEQQRDPRLASRRRPPTGDAAPAFPALRPPARSAISPLASPFPPVLQGLSAC